MKSRSHRPGGYAEDGGRVLIREPLPGDQDKKVAIFRCKLPDPINQALLCPPVSSNEVRRNPEQPRPLASLRSKILSSGLATRPVGMRKLRKMAGLVGAHGNGGSTGRPVVLYFV